MPKFPNKNKYLIETLSQLTQKKVILPKRQVYSQKLQTAEGNDTR